MRVLKQKMHELFVIKPEEVPQSYFDAQVRLARERGYGDYQIGEEQKEELTEVVVSDQESSLDAWIDYLSSKDAMYPDYLKYFAFRSITKMGSYDKEKKEFTKRGTGTTKPFPDINREALAYVLDALEKKHTKKELAELTNVEDHIKLNKLLDAENFAKLYAFAIDKLTPASAEQLENIKGKWVKYDQGSDHMLLVNSLQGHGTGWCTAGESTAQTQLANGDFHVYYSEDAEGNAKIPRVAIRMEGSKIAEVRGVAEQQNVDSHITPVVQEKMKEFPDGKQYEKKSADMRLLTQIENKVKKGEELNKDELVFLYEIDQKIEGFGYEKDPRVKELQFQRNIEEDQLIIFECTSQEIAHSSDEMNKNTKVYIGKFEPEVFKKLTDRIKYIYTSFPGKKIIRETVTGGEIGNQELMNNIKTSKIRISPKAEEMLGNVFYDTKDLKTLNLITLSLEELGLSHPRPPGDTIATIYQKAQSLGLELCPPEVSLYFSSKLRIHNEYEKINIAMNHILLKDKPAIFELSKEGDIVDINQKLDIDRWGNLYKRPFRRMDSFLFVIPTQS